MFAMWNSGITSGPDVADLHRAGRRAGLFLRGLLDRDVSLLYSRAPSEGLLFLIGTLVGCYNMWMTIQSVPLLERRESDVPAAAAVPGE